MTTQQTQELNIKQIAQIIELSEFRTRNLLKENRIRGTKQQIAGTQVTHWTATREAVQEYLDNKKSNNAKQYVVVLNNEQLAQLQAFATQNNIEIEFVSRYKSTASE